MPEIDILRWTLLHGRGQWILTFLLLISLVNLKEYLKVTVSIYIIVMNGVKHDICKKVLNFTDKPGEIRVSFFTKYDHINYSFKQYNNIEQIQTSYKIYEDAFNCWLSYHHLVGVVVDFCFVLFCFVLFFFCCNCHFVTIFFV